jgi:preprotein translocase subunit YajC
MTETIIMTPGLQHPGTTTTETQVGHTAGGGDAAAATEPQSVSIMPMLLIWGAVFAGMWFLMIRPQRKRERAMKDLQAGITTGDEVVTSGGLFGKVADVGDDCFIVEFGTNRGLRVPVLKADVVARRSPKMTPQPQVVETPKVANLKE